MARVFDENGVRVLPPPVSQGEKDAIWAYAQASNPNGELLAVSQYRPRGLTINITRVEAVLLALVEDGKMQRVRQSGKAGAVLFAPVVTTL